MKTLTASVNEIWGRLAALTQHAVIYARAQPADKMTLVRLYQRNGDVCAMTGDGGQYLSAAFLVCCFVHF
jgi:magnesium-transporting ATPase (P-type)